MATLMSVRRWSVPVAMLLLATTAAGEEMQLMKDVAVFKAAGDVVIGGLRTSLIHGTGVVGGSQYRLLLYADAGFVDIVLSAAGGAQCSIRRAATRDAEGVPIKAVTAAAMVPGEASMALRLGQAAGVALVYLYNEAQAGSCTASVQLS